MMPPKHLAIQAKTKIKKEPNPRAEMHSSRI